MLFCRDAAAHEDDVKSQLDKLWQEVNSLKEIQALQTGTTLTHTGQSLMKEAVSQRGDKGFRGVTACLAGYQATHFSQGNYTSALQSIGCK